MGTPDAEFKKKNLETLLFWALLRGENHGKKSWENHEMCVSRGNLSDFLGRGCRAKPPHFPKASSEVMSMSGVDAEG